MNAIADEWSWSECLVVKTRRMVRRSSGGGAGAAVDVDAMMCVCVCEQGVVVSVVFRERTIKVLVSKHTNSQPRKHGALQISLYATCFSDRVIETPDSSGTR